MGGIYGWSASVVFAVVDAGFADVDRCEAAEEAAVLTVVGAVSAAEDAEICFITEETLVSLFEKHPVTAVNYIAFLSDRIRFLNKKLSVISCSDAENTVLKYLTLSADDNGYAVIPVSMTELAKMLGLGRASLYRSLDVLEKRGSIIRENNKIKVTEK